ncbi:MAG: sensor histidine kinase N-terminal domain-containing protein [Burkholderiaceae bacterium]|nr:sensor histidine kinase N-terminal domain-containing protein [Burkholderiaceae bacterium]
MKPERQRPTARPPWSLEARLRRRLLGLLTGLWLVGTAAAGLGLWHETDEVLDSALAETAQRLLLLPETALSAPDSAESLAALGAHEEFVVYQVYGADGGLRLRSHAAPTTPLDGDRRDGLRQSGAWRVLTLSAADGSRRAQVAETTAHRYEVLWASIGWLLGMLLAVLPLAALATGWTIRHAFSALEPIRDQLGRRRPNDLRPVATERAPAELQPWLGTVNALLGRVAALVDSERCFAANTAHELRTPLAAARAQAQRLVQTSTDAATLEGAQTLLRQLDRLTRLATRLLQLARIESGVALQRGAVDLVQLAVLVADDFPDAQRSGRLQLEVLGQPTPVQGDIDALGIALRNLIDNALKFGGDTVQVTVRVEGQTLQVDDDGPGVPPDRLAGLVRRFDRGGSKQALVGSGLGLAMVDTIARQSGATLVLRSPLRDGQGFSASLQFDPDADQGTPHSKPGTPP